jgi:hypothetical protein
MTFDDVESAKLGEIIALSMAATIKVLMALSPLPKKITAVFDRPFSSHCARSDA